MMEVEDPTKRKEATTATAASTSPSSSTTPTTSPTPASTNSHRPSRFLRSRSRSPTHRHKRASSSSLMSVELPIGSKSNKNNNADDGNNSIVSSVTASNRSLPGRSSNLMDVDLEKLMDDRTVISSVTGMSSQQREMKESRSRSRSPVQLEDRIGSSPGGGGSVASEKLKQQQQQAQQQAMAGGGAGIPAGMMPMMSQAAPILMQMPAGMGMNMVPIMMVPQGNMFNPFSLATPSTPTATPTVTTNNLLSAADKVNRELFVGNTPPGTSEQLLIQFLNGAMQRTNLCAPYHKPIISCRVNTKFAFVECASVNDANAALNLNGIPFLGMNLRISRPSKYAGPHVPSKTWQELTGQPPGGGGGSVGSAGVGQDKHPEDKVNRELFIGNTTPEMTEKSLSDFLGKAMEQVGLSLSPGNPITACRASGKFAFVELRSVEETNNALNLNNIPYMGIQLRVGRPSKYAGPETEHGNWEDILAKYMSGELDIPENDTGKPTTRIVELRNMLTSDDLDSDHDYNEILEDTKDECRQFGNLKNIIIPRSGLGATKIFLEYATCMDAAKAIKALAGRTFDGRTIDATYMDEGKYFRKDYSD